MLDKSNKGNISLQPNKTQKSQRIQITVNLQGRGSANQLRKIARSVGRFLKTNGIEDPVNVRIEPGRKRNEHKSRLKICISAGATSALRTSHTCRDFAFMLDNAPVLFGEALTGCRISGLDKLRQAAA